jgi:hypothetical protein
MFCSTVSQKLNSTDHEIFQRIEKLQSNGFLCFLSTEYTALHERVKCFLPSFLKYISIEKREQQTHTHNQYLHESSKAVQVVVLTEGSFIRNHIII